MNPKNKFKLSIAIPSKGRPELEELLGQLCRLIPLNIQSDVEVLIGGNGPECHPYLTSLSEKFDNYKLDIKFKMFDKFLFTAEESAFRIMREASGEYIWLLGDDDVLLRIGVDKLLNYVNSDHPAIYFQCAQMTSAGQLLPFSSVIASGKSFQISYSNLVARQGINATPNGFGRTLIKRDILDFDRWQNVIDSTGALFSHVLEYSFALGSQKILVEPINLLVYKQNDYHEGSDSNWRKYGAHSGFSWITPFCGQLAGQIRYLVESEIWSRHEAEFSLFNERENTMYIADYLLKNVYVQILASLENPGDRFREIDIENLTWFFEEIATSRSISFKHLLNLYNNKFRLRKVEIKHRLITESKIFPETALRDRFGAGICAWYGTFPVYGHPGGWVIAVPSQAAEIISFLDPENAGNKSNSLFVSWEQGNNFDFNSLEMNSETISPSWVIGNKQPNEVSIPAVYSGPSIAYMRIARMLPRGLRNIFKSVLSKK